MNNNIIETVITDDGLFSKWVGAELVSAIDSQNNNIIAYVLRNRRTLTTTTMLGKPEEPPATIDIYVDALNEEGRHTVAIFKVPREMYEAEQDTTDRDCLVQLAEWVQNNHILVRLEEEELPELPKIKEVVENTETNKEVN